MNADPITHLSTAAQLKIVTRLFEACRHVSTLTESPFLNTEWIEKAHISVEFSDFNEKAKTLLTAVQWVVDQVAPDRVKHPFGTARPADDPTWTDPRWWSYSLLRHRYIEPILPDDYFEGTQLTGTLIALTGIQGRSAYYTELNRALGQTASIIRRELLHPQSSRIIQRRMLARMTAALGSVPSALTVLGMASVFFRAFSRQLLQDMAESESITGVCRIIEFLISEGCLVEMDDRTHVLVPPVIREHIYRQQAAEWHRPRHAAAAVIARDTGMIPDQIRHMQRSGAQSDACGLLMDNWGMLTSRCGFEELLDIIDGFRAGELTPEARVWVQICRGSHLIRFGYFERARAVFLDVQHAAGIRELRQLALIFLGHICSNIDPDAARRYFDTARTVIPGAGPFDRFLFSSLGRFHLARNEIAPAETCLLRALASPEHHLLTFTSVLLFALTDLYLLKGEIDRALKYGSDLVAFAESERDAHLTALALGTLGKIHMECGEWSSAMRYLSQSEAMHRERLNLNEVARIRVFQSNIHRRCGRLDDATAALEDALDSYSRLGVSSKEKVNVHIELARIFGERSMPGPACRHWQAAYRQAELLGLHDAVFRQLEMMQNMLPVLKDVPKPERVRDKGICPERQVALDLAESMGWVSSGRLIAATGIGRTKAYSILTGLVASGQLTLIGRGRGTRYLHIPESTGESRMETHEDQISEPGVHYLSGWVKEWIRKVGFITSGMLESRADVSRATAKRALAIMVKAGVLKTWGKGRNTRYGVKYES